MSKTCKICGEPLPNDSTKRRLYCSDTCRQRAKRARDNEPERETEVSFDDWPKIDFDWPELNLNDWPDFSLNDWPDIET